MSANDVERDLDVRHQEAVKALGISASPEEEVVEDENLEEKSNASEKSKDKSKESPEPPEDGDKDDEDIDDDDDKDDEDDDPEDRKSNKKTVPLKRFKQEKRERQELERKLEGVMKDLEELKSQKTPANTEEAIEDLDKITEDILKQIDDEEITDEQRAFLKEFTKTVLLKGKSLAPSLPANLKEKLKLLDDFQKEREEKSEAQSFDGEWNEFLPIIDKKFPGATPAMKAEAKALMDEISHSKEGGVLIKQDGKEVVKGYELEYLYTKNQKKFDTILGALKTDKSFEEGKKNVEEDSEDEDLDFLAGNMSPAKLQKRDEARTQRKIKDAQKTGKIRFV